MLSVTKKQLPGKNAITKTTSKPIAIPMKRDYANDNTPNSMSISSTPPNNFMEHLQKRMDQFATSPVFVYNLRS
jgi:hypothetical protein